MKTYPGKRNPNYRHGQTKTPLHVMWQNMHSRCKRKSCVSYRYYGGKGISVCEEWNDFVAFWNWAKETGYSDGLSIDRIDPNGNYEPSNCRWVTKEEQHAHTSLNRLIKYRGETYCLAQLARLAGMKVNTLSRRLNSGWSVEDAVNKPVKSQNGRIYTWKKGKVTVGISTKEAARLMDCSVGWVRVLCQRNEIGSVYPSIDEWMKTKPPKRLTYHIVPGQLAEYMRITEEELNERVEELRNVDYY